MEGIHCLNPWLTKDIPQSAKFQIFIAPLSPLTLSDGSALREDYVRLARRISRDFLHRGNDALHTVRKYASVRAGELEHIFPFADNADMIYNSSLVYELNVLRTKVKPLLEKIDKAVAGADYALVETMLKLLEDFPEVDAAKVPNTSVLMEFIGNSIFE